MLSRGVIVSRPLRPESLTYWSRMAVLRRLIFVGVISMVTLVTGVAAGLGPGAAVAMLSLVGATTLLPFVWQRPILAVYALFGGAVLIEAYNLGYPDSLTDAMPFFTPFNQMGIPLPFTVAEFLMVAAVGLMILKRIGDRDTPLETGPLFPALAVYTGFVAFGLVRGIGTGGELSAAIWEARAQFYPLMMYLLVYNLIEDRSQVRRLMWMFLAFMVLKGLLGMYRYYVTLGGDLSQVTVLSRANSLLSHEESLFFSLFFAFIILLAVFRADRRQMWFGIILSMPVLISFLANQRRAGTLSLLLALMIVAVMAYVLLPQYRKRLAILGIAVALALPPYVVAFGHSEGLIAEPARSIVSLYEPNERDAGSNEYREIEGLNVGMNISQSPMIGIGYGKEMHMFFDIPNLTYIFDLWAYIPHNTILWIWMRLGLLGFGAFWFLVARSMVEHSLVAKRVGDPYLRAMTVLGLILIVTWIIQGLLDMGMTDVRLMTLVGAFMGLTCKLPAIDPNPPKPEDDEESAPEETPVHAASSTRRRPAQTFRQVR